MPALEKDVSWARRPDGTYGYCLIPTPENPNDGEILDQLPMADSDDPLLEETFRGIRIRNVKIGRVVNSLTEISDCFDVEIAGLSLAPEGAVAFTPNEFVAEGPSAESFIADGSWRAIARQVKPGDRVILRFPPSHARDRLEKHVHGQGGVAKVEPQN